MSFIFLALSCVLFPSLLFVYVVLMKCTIPSPRLLYNTLGRDLRAIYRFASMQFLFRRLVWRNSTVGKLFQKQVKKHPNKRCILFDDQTWTYQQIEDYSNRVANAFIAAGYQKGDEVALFMENRPEYVCIWLGLSKIGVVSALINTNLRLHSLAHAINVITPKAVIFNANLAPATKDVVPHLKKTSGVNFLCLDPIESNLNSFNVTGLDVFLQDASKYPPDDSKHGVGYRDKLFYVYTSGTTGFPKAAIIRHSRFIFMGAATKYLMNVRDDDISYTSLPLYHTAGGILFMSNVLAFGGTVAIRTKFSASNFWSDVIKYKATVGQYIGEICRFLLNQPTRPEERQHMLRMMIGNGLRPQLYEEFQKRFCIPLIVEAYGSTEGNVNLINMFGKPKAVGFLSRIFSGIYPKDLIKVDSETGEPIRNENGLCVLCKPGEPGAIVGKIERNHPTNSFDGYANRAETNKKIIRNCYKKGDEVFNSGDILVMDKDGYFYFVDRTGDTFRWRGENVSTTEVEAIISKALGLVNCVVYGVEIPGTEGKAGMAAIQTEADIDMDKFHKQLKSSLPTYAIPVFVRICKQIEATGTYKLKKGDLQKESFNPTLTTDPIFMMDSKTRSYVRQDEKEYNNVIKGKARF